MISIVITAYKEQETIGKAIESFINQKIKTDYELIVSAPDMETLTEARKYSVKNKHIRLLKDPGKGKSYALNLIIKKLRGDIIILTDGDVYVSVDSVNEIIDLFNDKSIGCVTGRPTPMENKKTKYGYWANFLFDSAHKWRKKLFHDKNFLECSGYLWAFRNNIIDKIPLDVAEDTVVPSYFWIKGYKIGYAEHARVYVKNVDNWDDWIKQKTRTSKAHETLHKYVDVNKIPRTKTFWNEAKGAFSLFTYPRSLKQFWWSIELLFARLLMWTKVFKDTKLEKKEYQDGWERVESTK
ncbi:MAG: glycosyltransferase [Candidatus Pacearchaeota archaeon]|jgi:cellulose synthase/poly-beta-1,6-N-acetylglucosamine synthase-like glycosyltransferase